MTIIGTGNNVNFSSELVKRIVAIMLQPKDDRPEDRSDFVHPNLIAYLKENRKRILECLVGAVQIWVEMGRPRCSGTPPMGGFDEWAGTIGSILRCIRLSAWRLQERSWRKMADTRGEDLRALCEAWWRDHPAGGGLSQAMTSSELVRLSHQVGAFTDVIGYQSSERGQATAFGRRVLSECTDKPVGEWIIRVKRGRNGRLYFLELNTTIDRSEGMV